MHSLIRKHFAPAFGLPELLDSARLEAGGAHLAFTTDSYVVSPLFFPGGDIGGLSVYGTVNDLAMVGAEPLFLTAGFIIEEGFLMSELERVVSSMKRASGLANVKIVAGDTKVVEKGKGDGLFINTAGVGVIPAGVDLAPANIRPGDAVIVSGPLGGHGIAVIAGRNGLHFDPPLFSDARPLNGLVRRMLANGDHGIRALRDPTRGGLATTLKEFAAEAGVCIRVWEAQIPVSPPVKGACELLGLDPLHVASEGVLVAVVNPDMAEYHLDRMRKNEYAKDARIIGKVEEAGKTMAAAVVLETALGGERLLDMLSGEQLPRIC